MSYKPDKTLTRLEEEPESGFFGCTFSELKVAMRSGLIIFVIAMLCLMLLIHWTLATALAILPGVWWFFRKVKQFTRLRADKPLYYHRHVMTSKSARFIHPARRYQRERTLSDGH